MAAAYSQLCPEKIKRIFIFGRQTNFMPYKCGLSNFDHLETPLGRIMVDRNVNQKLLKSDDFRLLESNNDHKEQFIEMQLPFIAKIMENRKYLYTVIPVYIGALSHEQQRYIAKHFLPYLNDPSNVFIFSVSLIHWGEIYGMNTIHPETTTVLETIKKLDDLAITALSSLRFKSFDEFLLDTKSCVYDYQVYNIFLWMMQQFLDEDLYYLRNLDEEKAKKAMRKTASFCLQGQTWSFPSVTKDDSCISFISASIIFDEEKYIPDEPLPLNPLDKCV
ncbi:unnamed protein product [Trichobilharzia szidati]|nr:unnamed protein product [Trichobilharzia szidati]